jgi:hypothetical protein
MEEATHMRYDRTHYQEERMKTISKHKLRSVTFPWIGLAEVSESEAARMAPLRYFTRPLRSVA